MWVDERQQRIMEIIATIGRVEADAVAAQLRVSRETIRRDLMLLERDGLANRQVFPTKPPKVQYSLSPLGVSVLTPLAALVGWAEDNYAVIRDARRRFDAAPSEMQAP